ncbi:hypothetical protein Q7A53_05600 [Halobacillus rhizosphaerae]|uniref:hypothetical protein n=1 Tax=Halobacillus rhizosphaerae TaxID=3064889 RepID=UPI00398A8C3D
MNDMQMWHTILELKEDHDTLGSKGEQFFITDFPSNIETNDLDYVIQRPTWHGIGLGTGVFSYVLTNWKINQLFNVSDKTFKDLDREAKAKYLD